MVLAHAPVTRERRAMQECGDRKLRHFGVLVLRHVQPLCLLNAAFSAAAPPPCIGLQRVKGGAEHAVKKSGTRGKSFLQNEEGCRDGINNEKQNHQERCFSRKQKSHIHPYIFLYSYNLHCDMFLHTL